MIFQGRFNRGATLICSIIADRTSITDSILKDDIGVLLDNGQLPETTTKCKLFAVRLQGPFSLSKPLVKLLRRIKAYFLGDVKFKNPDQFAVVSGG
jgi:hypothetical protein